MPYVAGDGACIVDPYDVVAIRGALLKIKEDSNYRQKITKQGFENIKRFSEQNFTIAFLKVYKEIFK